MYDGYQVLTFDNKYKNSDLYCLSNELVSREGTGNYDRERTKYNIEFIPMINSNLTTTVYKKLKDNNIQYNENKKDLNLLNGVVVTSGQEFFKSLGMKFKDTNRTYLSGVNMDKPVQCCDINSERDIPESVLDYFEYSHNFLSKLVGKDNVIYSAIHFDEDTPHMHFYFMPVVDKVYRKIFETDDDGNRVLKEHIDKKGNIKFVPILKKDEHGKNVYKVEEGKFLNSDQFWKDKGGKNSFAIIQDKYNEFITSKGFNLSRGEIGAHKQHKTKLEYEIENLEIKKDRLLDDINFKDIDKRTKENIDNVDSEEILNPIKKSIIGYKDTDIENLKSYSKDLKIQNEIKDNTILRNKLKIESLEQEINTLKNYNTIKEKNKIIKNQKEIINKKDEEINFWKEKYIKFKNYSLNLFQKFANAIEILSENKPLKLSILPEVYLEKVNKIIDKFTHKYDYEAKRTRNRDDDYVR